MTCAGSGTPRKFETHDGAVWTVYHAAPITKRTTEGIETMPKYVPSEELKQRIAEPIEFVLKGKEFKIDAITQDMLSSLVKKSEDSTLTEFLGVFIGESEVESLAPIDLRELRPLVTWLMDAMKTAFSDEEKNAEESTEESPPHSQDSSDTQTS